MSYMWFTLVGTFITIAVGLLVSYITGFNKPSEVNRDLLTPVIHRFLPEPQSLEMKTKHLNEDVSACFNLVPLCAIYLGYD